MAKQLTLLPMNWQNFDDYCHMLADKIKKSKKKYSGIYGKARGGAIVGIRLSHLLDIPYVSDPNYLDSNGLYVDDIVESGETLKYTFNDTAVLFYNPNASFEPTFYVSPKASDTYIFFPWEQP